MQQLAEPEWPGLDDHFSNLQTSNQPTDVIGIAVMLGCAHSRTKYTAVLLTSQQLQAESLTNQPNNWPAQPSLRHAYCPNSSKHLSQQLFNTTANLHAPDQGTSLLRTGSRCTSSAHQQMQTMASSSRSTCRPRRTSCLTWYI